MGSSKKTDDESVVLDISDVAENGHIVKSQDQGDSTILEFPTRELPPLVLTGPAVDEVLASASTHRQYRARCGVRWTAGAQDGGKKSR